MGGLEGFLICNILLWSNKLSGDSVSVMIIMGIIHNVCLFTTGLPVPILQNLKHEEFLIGTFFFNE